MDAIERKEFTKQFTLQDYSIQQQERLFREQARKERNSNIPVELRPYWALGELGANVMTVPLEVLSRRHFGARYLGVSRVVLAVLFYGLVVLIGAQFNGYTTENTIAEGWLGRLYTTEHHSDVPDLMVVFAGLWIPAALYNIWVIKQRQRRRIRWHTRSTGISFFQGFLPGSDWTHYRFWEPLGWMGIGLTFLWISKPFGVYLMIAAGLLLIRNNQFYSEHNTERLNREDATIEVEILAGGVRDGGKIANYGYDPVTVPEDVEARIEDIERDLLARPTFQAIRRTVGEHAPRIREDIRTVVRDVTGQAATTAYSSLAAAQPTTPPAPAPASVWHQAEDWPEDWPTDSDHRGESATEMTPA